MTLDPARLFKLVAEMVPRALHQNILIVGSLAAAYHYRDRLTGQSVATKDADLIIHPAGSIMECGLIAKALLEAGWVRTTDPLCEPRQNPDPIEELRAIRLYPRKGVESFFVELIGMPQKHQKEPKAWTPCRVDSPAADQGWYGVPSFRFMDLLGSDRRDTPHGIQHASPPLMALANLLGHQNVGKQRIETGSLKGVLRSAKDLGRVLALSWLEPDRDFPERWLPIWESGLRAHFGEESPALARAAGKGLRELLGNDPAMSDVYSATSISLLRGHRVDIDKLRIEGKRVLQDLIEPLESAFALSA